MHTEFMAHPDVSIHKSFAAARHQSSPRPVQFVVPKPFLGLEDAFARQQARWEI